MFSFLLVLWLGIYFIYKILVQEMDSLLLSRIKKDKSPSRLQNLSPQKYGKAAWAELTYTPSKLADNILYREVTTMKKTQEGSSKLRQFQTLNGFMKERMNQLQLQRDGIESSLNQQITMYKKMLHESQIKHESRLKDIQKRFSSEINIMIQQKEEQAKFSQAEKEVLQNRISELQEQLKDSLSRQNQLQGHYKDLKHSQSNLTEKYNQSIEKGKNLERQKAIEQEEGRKRQEESKKKLQQTEQYFKEQIQSINIEKAKQKEVLERLMKTELEKAENLRVTENLRKGQELREVMTAFQNETKRLSEIISMKDRMLQAMTIQNTKNKEDILNITQNYEIKLRNQGTDNEILSSEVDQLREHIKLIDSQLQSQVLARKNQKDHFNEHMSQLKEELQYNQINYVRQRDKFEYWGSDLQKEILRLKGENMKCGDLMKDNERLSIELMNLRDLLMESSFEIDKSKEELRRMAFQRDGLALKAEKAFHDQDRMFRLKRQFEQQSWKANIQTHRPFYR